MNCLVRGVNTHIVFRNGKRWNACCWWSHLDKTGHTECPNPNCRKEIFIDTDSCPQCGTKLIFRAGHFFWMYGDRNTIK